MPRYFASKTPEITVFSKGGPVSWDFTTQEPFEGFVATDDPDAQAAFAACIAKRIGGALSEISEQEFAQKKNSRVKSRPPADREGFTLGSAFMDTQSRRVESTAAPSAAAAAAVPDKAADVPHGKPEPVKPEIPSTPPPPRKRKKP